VVHGSDVAMSSAAHVFSISVAFPTEKLVTISLVKIVLDNCRHTRYYFKTFPQSIEFKFGTKKYTANKRCILVFKALF